MTDWILHNPETSIEVDGKVYDRRSYDKGYVDGVARKLLKAVPTRLYAKVAKRLGDERAKARELDVRREEMRKLAVKYETRIDQLKDAHKEEVRLLKLKLARMGTELGEIRKVSR